VWTAAKEVTAVLAALASKKRKKRTQPESLHFITVSERAKILEMKEQGMSCYRISQILGLNISTVRYHAELAGYMSSKKMGRPPVKYCITSKATGIVATGTIKQCARQLCISEQVLRAHKYRAEDGLNARYAFEVISE
jgi:DNA-binding CsgD family transcriptional regulator